MTNITMAPTIAPIAKQANAIPTAPPVVNKVKNENNKTGKLCTWIVNDSDISS